MTNDIEAPAGESHGRWPMIGWVLFALVSLLLVVLTLTEVLMRAAVLDVLSFWPAWVLALLMSLALWPLRRRGVTRIGAVLPLLLFSWVAGALSLHLQRWELLPSASADLVGPPAAGVRVAALTLEVAGNLQVTADARSLYEVDVDRRGGDVAPPEALERLAGEDATIELREGETAGWFGSSGWDLDLSRTPDWELVLSAAEVDIDLRGVGVRSISVRGDGLMRLGAPAADVEVTVDGDVDIELPPGVAAEVEGAAQVPEGWIATETGVRFEADGPVIRITTLGVSPIIVSNPSDG